MKRFVQVMLTILLAAWAASACGPTANSGSSTRGLAVNDPWARPAKAGANSAIYFIIDNQQGQADTILAVQCDAAMMAEMHKTQTDAAGKSSMVKQESVPVPAGGQTRFEPGGLHIMLMNLKQDLEPGQKLPVTLKFEKAGEVKIEAIVRQP